MTFVHAIPRTLKIARVLVAGLFLSTAFVFTVSTDASAKLARRGKSAPVDLPDRYTQDWEDEVEAKKRREDSGTDWREPSARDARGRDQVPEIDPSVARGAATLLLGGLTLLRYRRKH